MVNVIHAPHINRIREARFREALLTSLPGSVLETRCFRPEAKSLSCLVDRDQLLRQLATDTRLPTRRRVSLMDELRNLPEQIRIACNPNQVSFDFAMVKSGKTFLIEFHEEQHRNLKDNRQKKVYSKDEKEFTVPRFVQRFLKDVWRIQTMPNVSIVWFDWFAQYGDRRLKLPVEGFREFSIPGRF